MNAGMIRTGLILFCALFASAAQAAVIVSGKATQNMSCSAGVCTPAAKKAILNATDLANMLASGDVTVNTAGSVAKDIEIDTALSWISTSRLTLDAYHSITFNKPVMVAGTGALTITTSDGAAGGDFRFFGKGHVQFWDGHSSLIINGNPYTLVRSIDDFVRVLGGHEGTRQFFALQKDVNSRTQYDGPPIRKPFNGTFEGLGNAILNLYVSTNNSLYVGFFTHIKKRGIVRDLRLEEVTMSGEADIDNVIGALAGSNEGIVMNCFASGTVSNFGWFGYAGGLIGSNNAALKNSSSAVAVAMDGRGSVAGGLAGANSGRISQSYATGSVTGVYEYDQEAGGLIGLQDGSSISDSYATGAVIGNSNAHVGGLVGDTFDSLIMNAYSIGAVSGGPDAIIGGLIGQDEGGSSISDAFWDLDTSGISDPSQGAGNIPNDPGIAGLTDAQLKSGLPAGFDPHIWAQSPSINNGYPYLIANPPPK